MDTSELPGSKVLVVDDVADSGRTLKLVMEIMEAKGVEARSAVLYSKPQSIVTPDYSWKDTDLWITFPWSAQPRSRVRTPLRGSDAPSPPTVLTEGLALTTVGAEEPPAIPVQGWPGALLSLLGWRLRTRSPSPRLRC